MVHCQSHIRMDGCEYMQDGNSKHGLVQCIIRSSRHQSCEFLIIRRLVSKPRPPGNSAPTAKYNHEYYTYVTNDRGYLQLDLVPARHIQYPLFFVSDPCNGTTHFGEPYTDVHKFETDEHWLKSRFFRAASVSITSFREGLNFLDDN